VIGIGFFCLDNCGGGKVMKSKVSVIVPVYNVEQYVERCLRSIMDQTFKNIEIIVVDDGTKDSSGEIADKLALLDDRIKVIHKQNEGVSTARNVGLNNSNGDYIVFVDSDDYLEIDCIEHFVDVITNTKTEIVCGLSHYSVWNTEQNKKITYSIINSVTAMEYIYLEKINVAVWNKMYSRKLLVNNGILFNKNIWYGEGMLFNIESFQCTEKIALTNKKVYHQTFNPQSAMRDFNLKSNLCGLRSLDLQKEKWLVDDPKLLNAWEYHYWYFNFSILKGLIKTHIVNDNKELYKKCREELRRYAYAPIHANLSLKRKMVDIFIFIAPFLAAQLFILKDKLACNRVACLKDSQVGITREKL